MKIRICIDGNIVTQPNKTTVYEIEHIHPDGSTSQVEAVSEREFNESVFLLARHQHQNQFYFNFYIDTNNIPRVSGYIISFYSESSIIKIEDLLSSYTRHKLSSYIKQYVKRPSTREKAITIHIPVECFLLNSNDLRKFLQLLTKEIISLQKTLPDAKSNLKIILKAPKANFINEYFIFLSSFAEKIISLSIKKVEGIFLEPEKIVFMQLLSELLSKSPNLTSLCLRHNNLRSDNLEFLSRPLSKLRKLKSLNFQGNAITSLNFICTVLAASKSICLLNIHKNKIRAHDLISLNNIFSLPHNISLINIILYQQNLLQDTPDIEGLSFPNSQQTNSNSLRQQENTAFLEERKTTDNLITRNSMIKSSKLISFILSLRTTNSTLYKVTTDLITISNPAFIDGLTPLSNYFEINRRTPNIELPIYNKDIVLNILSFISCEFSYDTKETKETNRTLIPCLNYLSHRLQLSHTQEI